MSIDKVAVWGWIMDKSSVVFGRCYGLKHSNMTSLLNPTALYYIRMYH